ncbi:MAG: choice-of-anchor V domain-containing protein [Chitinophagales bacterium]
MLRKITLLSAIIFAFITVWNYNYQTAQTYGFQPPPNRAGAPGMLTCGTSSCHGGTVNSGNGIMSITLDEGIANYETGMTYDVQVAVNETTKNRFGFELVALGSNGNSAGVFSGQALNVGFFEEGGIEYAAHFDVSNPSDSLFNFQWTAPDEDMGTITFYGAGLAANGNGNKNGDNTYTTSLDLNYQVTGIGEPDATTLGLNVYPNPAMETIQVDYQVFKSDVIRIGLYNLNGQLVEQLFEGTQPTGVHAQTFTLNKSLYPSGTYMLFMEGAKHRSSHKILTIQ